MATIKSYTDLQQSKVLAEILPLESADMYYFRQIDNDYFPTNVESICPIPLYKDGKEDFNYDIRCWSLATLLGVLPKIDTYRTEIRRGNNCFCCVYTQEDNNGDLYWYYADNPVDACYETIICLHELKML